MKPAPFALSRPATIAQACAQLAEAGGGAQILAGGQTLMPLLNLRMSQPFVLVDVNGIAALRGVNRADGVTRIGAATRQAEALTDAALAAHLPALVRAIGHIGHHQTRNRGTIGDSVALGEPAAEIPACAVALGASIEAVSQHGTRSIAARDFYLGPYMTTLAPDELVTAVRFPDWPAEHIALFREVAQRPGDFALVGLAGALVVEAGVITRAGLAWFGMGPTPIAAVQAEAALVGAAVAGLDIAAIARAAVADTAPFDDHHASADYRRLVGERIFAGALGEALGIRKAA